MCTTLDSQDSGATCFVFEDHRRGPGEHGESRKIVDSRHPSTKGKTTGEGAEQLCRIPVHFVDSHHGKTKERAPEKIESELMNGLVRNRRSKSSHSELPICSDGIIDIDYMPLPPFLIYRLPLHVPLLKHFVVPLQQTDQNNNPSQQALHCPSLAYRTPK